MFRTAWDVFGTVFMTAFYLVLTCVSVVCLVGGSYVAGTVVGLFALAHFLLYRRNRRLERMRDPQGAVGLSALHVASVPAVAAAETSSSPNIPRGDTLPWQSDTVPPIGSSHGSSETWHIYGEGDTSTSILSAGSHYPDPLSNHDAHVSGSDWRGD
ncbi:MAG: hypothetical protein AAGH68_14570 [Pseudomonadota bacterium]